MYLAGWKETLPADHLPFWPRVSLGIPRYPPGFCGKGAIHIRTCIRWRVSVGSGGYPPADSGYPETSSKHDLLQEQQPLIVPDDAAV
ncbi:ATP-dependent DNA helicase sgs1 [Puccinia graminis f. sp. tritici]|uniref:ATP-dependent DNA helicase sgs1 n=1 Tax=Puccinia graminis f. sp. tritici TaxID=56615 RepID=A0A5B0QWN9_PUCGR|nr:ATP-dependent DNA helicase sgs1 [Puccinia graminis f. sp. tritici]